MVLRGVLLPSTARTATTSTSDVTLTGTRGVQLYIDFTATPNNSETATVSIEAKDPASGKYQAMTAFAALTASGLGANPTTATYLYTIYPGGAETAATANHEVQALPLPQVWRVKVTHSSSGSWTYTLGFSGCE